MEEINDDLIKLLNDFNKKYSLLKQSLPYHLNVIDELHINENAHSRILCKLLQYQSESGKYEFLESLIKYIINKDKHNESFSKIKIKNPEITQEKERIDLWVKDKEYAIIFENKVYDATDQEAQIARYINKTRVCNFEDDKIYVIYMPSTGECETSEQTWIDNSDPKNQKDLKEKFQERYVKLSFREDILDWLKEHVLPNIKYKDQYLLNAILQYIDYLEGLFDKRTINNKMNMELKDYIEKVLGFEDTTSDVDRIKIINEKEAEIQKLLAHMSEVKAEVSKQIQERELNLWKTKDIRNKIEEIAKEVCLSDELKEQNLYYDINYNEETSDFWIKFYKEGWELSIVFEKKFFDHTVFIYVGIPSEEKTDDKYWKGTPKVFKHKDDKEKHPYGWDYVDLYNHIPQKLIEDINNGNLKEYLKRRITTILKQIQENNLFMA